MFEPEYLLIAGIWIFYLGFNWCQSTCILTINSIKPLPVSIITVVSMVLWHSPEDDSTGDLQRYQSLRLCLKFNIQNCSLNALRWRQNGHYFPDDIFKQIFLNENCCILIKISLKFFSPINIIPTLVQIMTWRQSGDKPLSESVMA